MFTVANFPQQYVKGTNCLGFVLGKPGVFNLEAGYIDPDSGHWVSYSIVSVMAKCLYDNNIKAENRPWQKGQTALYVFGWFSIPNPWQGYDPTDFHVIRVNPNGSVEHKPDSVEPPKKFGSIEDFYANTDYKPNELAGSFVLV